MTATNQKIHFRRLFAPLSFALFSAVFTISFPTVLIGSIPQAHAFSLEVADAPTNNLALATAAIRSAQHSILMNIYEFSEPSMADAVLERIQAGIHVEILEEGQPVGGMSAAARGIQSRLISAMQASPGQGRFFEMHSNADARLKRRFRYDHAKYMVIDGQSLYLGSENYSPSGHPQAGTTGNRGWDAFIHQPNIAQTFTQIFTGDTDTSHGDIIVQTPGDSHPSSTCLFFTAGCGTPRLELYTGAQTTLTEFQPRHSTGGSRRSLNGQGLQADRAEVVTSPDNSLSGLLALIQRSQHTLDIEQMSFSPGWKSIATGRSPLMDAVIAAAERGVQVRVLLNDDTVFIPGAGPDRETKNKDLVRELTSAAQSRHLPIHARIANLRAMGVTIIHNKGVLVDGNQTLISSINWGENSVKNNREAAVILTSPGVNAYFQPLFEKDWSLSIQGQSGGAPAQKPSPAEQDPEDSQNLSDTPPDPIDAEDFFRPRTHLQFLPTESCPVQIDVEAHFGEMNLAPSSDPSLGTLSGTTLVGHFEQDRKASSCLLIEKNTLPSTPDHPAEESLHHRYIQIRTAASGTQSIALEGYTARGKLYSIRAPYHPNTDLNASVYDGSSPRLLKIGTATLHNISYQTQN